jgi:1,4-dihydroxy-2-naphthoate octaprenyltransferase
VIELGFHKAHWLYSAFSISAFLWVAGCIVFGLMPIQCLFVFISLPFAARAIALSRKPDFGGNFTKAQAANVVLVLTAHFLLALGYYFAA